MKKPGLYTKLPIAVEAMQITDDNAQANAVHQWIEDNTLGSFEPMAVINSDVPPPESGVSIDPRNGQLMIATLEGVMWAGPGDWIIRGVEGEFYPCQSHIFDATYRPAEQGWDV